MLLVLFLLKHVIFQSLLFQNAKTIIINHQLLVDFNFSQIESD